jgi:hypothetical protein
LEFRRIRTFTSSEPSGHRATAEIMKRIKRMSDLISFCLQSENGQNHELSEVLVLTRSGSFHFDVLVLRTEKVIYTHFPRRISQSILELILFRCTHMEVIILAIFKNLLQNSPEICATFDILIE